MNIERFKNQHIQILEGIASLRKLAHSSISDNAHHIAQQITALSTVVTMHLAIEDRILYPSLQNGSNQKLADMGKAYQADMKGIANAFIAFSRKWSTAIAVVNQPEMFRTEANQVLKAVYDRMQKEDTEFYPAIEAS